MRSSASLRHAVICWCGVALCDCAAVAQVVTDGTVGPVRNLSGPTFQVTPDLGQVRGTNLFHSFQTFSINPGETASFSGPTTVSNVLARVTGGQTTGIAGRLQSTIPNANLYLINPAGIVFLPGASLDVSGSFVATTADVVKLGDGGQFPASPSATTVLSSAPPAAFGFLAAQPAEIVVAGDLQTGATSTSLRVPTGKALSLVGGNVTLALANLSADSGTINLVSAGSPGDVVGDAADPTVRLQDGGLTSRGAVSVLLGSNLTADAATGLPPGRMNIRAADATLDNVSILGVTSADVDPTAAGVTFDLTGTLSIRGGANVFCTTFGTGRGPDVEIDADRVMFANPGGDPSGCSVFGFGPGDVGAIRVRARSVEIGSQGAILSTGIDAGRAGDIELDADSITIAGPGASIGARASSGGARSGDVRITADQLRIADQGNLSNRADSAAFSGNLIIDVDELTASGTLSTISSSGGTIEGQLGMMIDAREILVENGAIISSASFNEEAGGQIRVRCEGLTLRGGALQASTVIGRSGGTIDVTASREVLLQDGVDADGVTVSGGIASDTSGTGRGGTVRIASPLLTMSQTASIGTFAGTGTEFLESGGAGGDIFVDVGRLAMSGRSGISAAAISTAGGAGTVSVRADSVSVTDEATINSPTVGATTVNLSGTGGLVRIDAREILLDGGQVFTNTASSGNAGNIEITADALHVTGAGGAFSRTRPNPERDPSQFPEDPYGNGGNIRITARSVTLADAGSISSESLTPGDAGNVMVESDFLTMGSGSTVATSGGERGNGGTITLVVARELVVRDSAITATAARSAQFRKNGGNIDMTVGELVYLFNGTLTAEAGNDGGNITIDPRAVVLNHGSIIANAISGDGGDISITSRAFLTSPDSTISASSEFGLAGNIQITSPEQDLAGALARLPAFLASPARLQDVCADRIGADVSSFIVQTRGGLAPEPVGHTASRTSPATRPTGP